MTCLLMSLACASGTLPSKGDPGLRPVSRDKALFPLEEGRIWTFERPRVARRVTVRATAEPTTAVTRLDVVGPKGAVFARLAWMGSDLLMGGPGRKAAILVRLPAREGDEWVAAPGLSARVLADESVTVPAGDFRCLVVRFTGDGLSETYWMAPGVGFVRILREQGEVRDEALLVSYASGKAR
jgi:hypothetical protein